EDLDSLPYLVVAVIEVESSVVGYARKFKRGEPVRFRQKLVPKSTATVMLWPKIAEYEAVLLESAGGRPMPSVAKQFQAKKEDTFKGREKPDPQKVLPLARWALEHGLTDKVATVLDELAKSDQTNTIVAAYLKVKADLAKPLPKEDLAETWKGQLLDG